PPPPPHVVPSSNDEDGFAIAPDFRFSEIGHETAVMAGVYGGYVFAGRLLLGAGGYWQTNSTFGEHLSYGGPVVECRLFPESRVGVKLHALVGAGQFYADDFGYGRDVRNNIGRPVAGNRYDPYYRYHDVFFVAEPEAQIVVRLASLVRVQAGAGYRA